MKKQKARKGFSLVELLIAVVVLGILSAIAINTGTTAQKRARVTAALTGLSDYETAFTTAVVTHPGVMGDREEAWGTDGSSYTANEAFKRLVFYMNESLEADLQLVWNPLTNCFESQKGDPWGGKYTLTEYPLPEGETDGYDPTTGSGLKAMRVSIWATGNDAGIIAKKVISADSVGVGLTYQGGNVSTHYHGVNDEYPYTDWRLNIA